MNATSNAQSTPFGAARKTTRPKVASKSITAMSKYSGAGIIEL
jgi:hypothetical protein